MRFHIIEMHPEWCLESLSAPLSERPQGQSQPLLWRHMGALGGLFPDTRCWSRIFGAAVPLLDIRGLVRACAGRAPTVILVKLRGSAGLLGGGTSAVWTSGQYAKDSQRGTFVFFTSDCLQAPQRVDQAAATRELAWCDETEPELGFKSAFIVSKKGECHVLKLSNNDWMLGSSQRTLTGRACGVWTPCEEVEAWWTDPR